MAKNNKLTGAIRLRAFNLQKAQRVCPLFHLFFFLHLRKHKCRRATNILYCRLGQIKNQNSPVRRFFFFFRKIGAARFLGFRPEAFIKV